MESKQFSWNPDDYANNSSAQMQWTNELIAKLDLKGCESILDIGCGDGKITAQLAQIVRNGYVLGIDSSESMIRRDSEQFPTSVIPNLSFPYTDRLLIGLREAFLEEVVGIYLTSHPVDSFGNTHVDMVVWRTRVKSSEEEQIIYTLG